MIHFSTIPIAVGLFASSIRKTIPISLTSRQSGTPTCLHSPLVTTLEQLVDCLKAYTVPHDYYNQVTYKEAQPTTEERLAWFDASASLLTVDRNCSLIILPSAIAGKYSISLYIEHTGASYCVLSESRTHNGVYVKGWGLLVVPDSVDAVHRHLHISAPHPVWDSRTPAQAAALFGSIGAKSLLIPGRTRTAFMDPTNCVKGNSGQDIYHRTDPTHDTSELFYETNKVINSWQTENGGCASSSCAFIQFHGKSASTCSSDDIFLSTGLGRDSNSVDWYTNSVQRPVKRLKSQLEIEFPDWNISLPSDSRCSLTATKNVVGRFLNGIDDTKVCEQASNANLAMGTFIHIEQAAVSREEKAYGGWTKALAETFDVVQVQI
ncbi:hypothetical protein BDZ94DRAFT_1312430 [Collybia nuda]|uniref:Uncharacterized protein n=1 Tax=Collybia nuda TaxID=64659 RepID=A0A9P5Y1A4_9AGAR|nr:hypothetical protein BDZ94DRAFT_1312430 [Collybia nuda]